MKYLKYFKPEVLYEMVKASGQNLLSLGFGTNSIETRYHTAKMKYLKYFKPEVLYEMVKASGQNLLSLGFGTNNIGICVIDASVGRSFLVPVLESCDGNFTLNFCPHDD
ncbi:hypothetical protein Q3G72_003956 [Acer saccharum]|nr:hypothetical protein Q3G72_003956 [Acer saccharum]